jgi:hypothetical protein
VPLRVRDKMMGVIEVVNRLDGSVFSEDDEELLSAVAIRRRWCSKTRASMTSSVACGGSRKVLGNDQSPLAGEKNTCKPSCKA